jgi:hypothetical protein
VLLRLSSGEQVDVLRDLTAVDAMAALRDDPVALAAVKERRVANGYAPLTLGGQVTIADGARISSSRSLAMDATTDTVLGATTTLEEQAQTNTVAPHGRQGERLSSR